VDEWMDRMAQAIGEEPMTPAEAGAILKLAREVAHGVERKVAPLSTFLAGVYVGRQTGAGISRQDALARAVEAARDLIPSRQGDEGTASDGER
jgi:uncharacterized protein DUF6457